MRLFNEDCLLTVERLAAEGVKVDALITDPPYNISKATNFTGMHARRGGSGMYYGDWDVGFDLTGWIQPATKILKDNANVVIFNCWENLGKIAEECRRCNIDIKRCLTLNKTNPPPFNRDRVFVNNTEFALWGIYHSRNKPTGWTFNRTDKYEKTVFNCHAQQSRFHPTTKDITVIRKLLSILTNEGDTVADLFMGGGTIGLACKEMNRHFIGVEIDTQYYKNACERVNFT